VEGGGTHIDFHFGARTRLPQWVFFTQEKRHTGGASSKVRRGSGKL